MISPKYPNIEGDESFKPKDFYKELAEYGLLDDFVKDRMQGRFDKNKTFKEEIVNALINYSVTPVQTVDIILLNKLKDSLSKFLERAESCKK